MSVLFAHDHRFIVRGGRAWSSGKFSTAIFDAYASVFGPVTVAARSRLPLAHENADRLTLAVPNERDLIVLPNLSTLRNLLFPDRRAVNALRSAVAANDVVIARLPSEIGLLALREARRQGKPAIVEVVGCARDALAWHGARFAASYAPLAFWRMRRAIAAATHVHYVSSHFLQKRYPTAGASIGVSDVEIERPSPDILDRRLARIDDHRPPVFGMVTTLFNRQKGVEVAIRALAIARRDDPTLTLRILGPGDATPWQALADQEGIGEAVRFCGLAERGEAVLDWLDTIDVYVQASFQEGLPRALIEAMRQATPALASAAGGTSELIGHDWLHAPGDARTLARQMLAVRPATTRIPLARENFANSLPFSADETDAKRLTFWRSVARDHGIAGADAN